jgi:hypothetical protein
MSECRFCFEDYCALELFLKKKLKSGEKHPCSFAILSGLGIVKVCTAKESDLVEVDEDEVKI